MRNFFISDKRDFFLISLIRDSKNFEKSQLYSFVANEKGLTFSAVKPKKSSKGKNRKPQDFIKRT